MRSPSRPAWSGMCWLLPVLCLLALTARSHTTRARHAPAADVVRQRLSGLPLYFEDASVDRGNGRKVAAFTSRGADYQLWLTPGETVVELATSRAERKASGSERGRVDQPARAAVLRSRLVGANPKSCVHGDQRLPGKTNYLIGNDPAKWRRNCPTYARVRYDAVYPGVDLVYYGKQGELEYDFIVQPGADPGMIRFATTGAEHAQLAENGDLVLRTDGAEVRQRKPVLYQERGGKREPVAGAFQLAANGEVGFRVGEYDRSRPLVIDPTLQYSTFFGGTTSSGSAIAVAVDASGAVYVGGGTFSTTFPTLNAVQPAYATTGNSDGFIAKFSPDLSTLLYATYLGGSYIGNSNGQDQVDGIVVDASGSAYLTGWTESRDFPIVNAAQATYGRGIEEDAWAARLSPTGSALIYSTYLAGFGQDFGNSVAIDAAGNAFFGGTTASTDFPVANAYQATMDPSTLSSGFIVKLGPTGNRIFSTYFGVNSAVSAVKLDAAGNVVFGGFGRVQTTPGAYKAAQSGPFVARMTPDGQQVLACAVVSSSGGVSALALDDLGSVYLAGDTNGNSISAPQVFRVGPRGGQDVYVLKVVADLSQLSYSVMVGGAAEDRARGVGVDGGGNVYLAGYTVSPDFPTTPGSLPLAGSVDAFVTCITPAADGLVYSVLLGGSGGGGVSGGYGMTVTSGGTVYLVGGGNATDYPVTPGAYSTTCRNAWFISVLQPDTPAVPLNLAAAATSDNQVQLTWTAASTATLFRVECMPEGGSFTQVAVVSGRTRSYLHTGLSANSRYTYRIRAVNGGGISAYSNQATVTTLPKAPTGLTAAARSATQVDLQWTDPNSASGAAKIERSVDGTAFSPLVTLPGGSSAYSDMGLSASTAYWYRVRVSGPGGDSLYSNVANATTLPPPPAAPTNLTAAALSSTSIQLRWTDASSNESGFKIQRRSGSGGFAPIGAADANSTSFTDTGLQPDTLYTYLVLASNAGSDSAPSNEASAATLHPPPTAPSDVHVTVTSTTSASLSWTDNSGDEAGFRIERAANGGAFVESGLVAANQTTYEDPGLNPNTTYVFQVRAYNANGASDPATAAPVTTPPNPPDTPSGLRAVLVGTDQASLSWTDNSTSEDSFIIERAVGTNNFVPSGVVGANITTYLDKNLQPETTYAYRVRAVTGTVNSAPSNTASVTTPVLPPLAPANLSAQAAGVGGIDLAWTDRSGNETGFLVERSPDGASFTQIGTTNANTALFHDSGLPAGTTFYYRVRSTNAGGTSAPSNVAQATTLPAPPAAPTGLRVTGATAGSINLAWDAVPGATGYSLERRNPGGEFAPVASPTATTYSDAGLQPNTTYAYRLRASNAGGPSPYSAEVSGTTGSNLPAPPGMPASFAAEVLSATSVRLTWNTPSALVSSYRLERSTSGGAFAPVGPPGAADTSYTDTGLQPNTAYQYRLAAGNAGGQSPFAGPVSATTLPNPPAVPGGLTVTGLTASAITLRWNASEGAEHYVLERKTGTGEFAFVANLSAATTTYTDHAVAPGVAYAYRVKAANPGGESGYSSTVAATIPAGGRLKLSTRSVNFGIVARGKTGKKTLKLTNTGKGPLIVTVGTLAAPFQALSGTGMVTLAPKKSLTVTLQFTPTATAPASANLAITSTDPAASAVSVGLTGRSR